jgi:hypothetical protein
MLLYDLLFIKKNHIFWNYVCLRDGSMEENINSLWNTTLYICPIKLTQIPSFVSLHTLSPRLDQIVFWKTVFGHNQYFKKTSQGCIINMVSSSKFFSYSYILLVTANNIPTCRFLLRMESVEDCVSKYIMNWKITHLVPIVALKLTDNNLSFSLFVAHKILGFYRCISSHFEPILGSCWIIAPVLLCSKPLNFSYETSQNVMETQAFEALGKKRPNRKSFLFDCMQPHAWRLQQ